MAAPFFFCESSCFVEQKSLDFWEAALKALLRCGAQQRLSRLEEELLILRREAQAQHAVQACAEGTAVQALQCWGIVPLHAIAGHPGVASPGA